jgi:type IV secretory pathway TraG/TraD family ATPase VirD4
MDDITFLGRIDYRNLNQKFGIKDDDRSNHIYCLGKTGVGKSTLLLSMAISDIRRNKGIGIIDPHGDISDALLDYIPVRRIKDVVLLDVGADKAHLPTFNPLDIVEGTNTHLVASNVITALKKAWVDSWGPRMEHILRHALLTLLEFPNTTLADIQPLLTDAAVRTELISRITNQSVLLFWQREFNALSPTLRAEAISPIVNKIGLFQTHPVIRAIMCKPRSSFSISNLMNNGKIFIANLSKGILGEDGCQLLGSLLIAQFQTAAISRAAMPLADRRPFYLFVDEMHSFITMSVADMLSEARKYGLCLFLTHQYSDQLGEHLQNAIVGNVGTLICFRLGSADAEIFEKEFMPVFRKEDLIALPRYHIYLKLSIDGAMSTPFSAITMPLPPIERSYRNEIVAIVHRSNKAVETPVHSITDRVPGDQTARTLFDI